MNLPSDDYLIRVNTEDKEIGYELKETCHQGQGLLHRAFSIFIFNTEKKLLMQKRSALKLLWPLYWSNSVCSHPRRGESLQVATQRRLKEEINIEAPLQFLFKFTYHSTFKDVGSENELCSVFIGVSNAIINANPTEIAEWKYMHIEEIDLQVKAQPESFTPWFKIEWQQIRMHHMKTIESLTES